MKIQLAPLKRFRDTTLELAPLTLLTGVNCGGKTSILQSLIIARILSQIEGGEDVTKLFSRASVTGLPLGEPRDYCPYEEEDAIVRIEGSGSRFEYELRLDNSVQASTSNIPQFLTDGQWRISTLATVPLASEQWTGDRQLDDRMLDGQHALIELADRGLTPVFDPSSSSPSTLRIAVEHNISQLSAPTEIKVERISSLTDRLSLLYRAKSIESDWTSPIHHGAGITAMLPLLVHLCAAKSGDYVVIQDPEVNLHPWGQSQLGRLLVNVAGRGVQLIVESHSEHILNGIRLGALGAGKALDKFFSCYYFGTNENSGSTTSEINFDSRGRILDWPSGFFDQAEIDLGAILRRV